MNVVKEQVLKLAVCIGILIACIIIAAPWRFMNSPLVRFPITCTEDEVECGRKGCTAEPDWLLFCNTAVGRCATSRRDPVCEGRTGVFILGSAASQYCFNGTRVNLCFGGDFHPNVELIVIFAGLFLATVIGIVGAGILFRRLGSVYRAFAVLCLFVISLQTAVEFGGMMHAAATDLTYYNFSAILWLLATICIDGLITARLSAVALALRAKMLSMLMWLRLLALGASCSVCVVDGLKKQTYIDANGTWQLILALNSSLILVAGVLLGRVYYELHTLARTPWGKQINDRFQQMRRIAVQQCLTVLLLLLTDWLSSFSSVHLGMLWWSFLVKVLGQTFTTLVMAGVFEQKTASEVAANAAEVRRLQRHGRAERQYKPCAEGAWQEMVEELAARGFTLKQLLCFYTEDLPKAMPHFDPTRHRTVDVARCAIIPLSADLGCALANKMTGGQGTRPQTMVTHNWSNLFRDLIAAIVSDALDEPYYEVVADLLDKDISKLMTLLTPRLLAKTYWICAFSVSQHNAICAENPGRTKDPVTGEEHPVCDCGQPKHFNATPPLRSDGKSFACQMNKFDDMMAFLASTDQHFRQLVAVDRNFGIFGRAWCVAELAEADKMGMPQSLAMASRQSLENAKEILQDLRIERMHAARPEDVDEILAKIPDVPGFNKNLHELLLGTRGLLVVTKSLDAMEKAIKLGQLVFHGRVLGPHSALVEREQKDTVTV